MQARLSLRWPHVREISSHELTRFVKHDAEACKNQFTSQFVRLCVRVMVHWNHLMCSIFYPNEHAQIQKVLPEGVQL